MLLLDRRPVELGLDLSEPILEEQLGDRMPFGC